MSIRVLIVDDHPFVRRGLREFLDGEPRIDVAGEAADGAEAIAFIDQTGNDQRPDVVLMDLMMPGIDGVEATRTIAARHPDVKVVILTSFGSTDAVVPALAAGAAGYVLKDVEPDDLVVAITAASRGQTLWSPAVAQAVRERLAFQAPADESPRVSTVERRRIELLTRRETEVLTLLGQGLSNSDIAAELVVSEKTVKTHVSNILAKLRVTDRTQAAVLAVRAGLA